MLVWQFLLVLLEEHRNQVHHKMEEHHQEAHMVVYMPFSFVVVQ